MLYILSNFVEKVEKFPDVGGNLTLLERHLFLNKNTPKKDNWNWKCAKRQH